MGWKTAISGALAVGVLTVAAASAQAGAITVDAGWVEFSFGDVGSSWDDTYTFTAVAPVQLKVTDGYLSGDRFEVTVFDGVSNTIFSTSLPGSTGDQIGTDYDTAFADSRWSSGSILLGPGSYTVSGEVLLSPFQGGGGALRVDTQVVPLPAAGWMGLAGLGLVAAVRRRRRS